jgi:hypothetical protein
MSHLEPIIIDQSELQHTFGLGVAGNFAGHLEQAGEAIDFVNVNTPSASMPKGIFPWYAPGSNTFLGNYPLSADTLAIPPSDTDTPYRIQIEPELAMMCEVIRSDTGDVAELLPRWIAAFDDCSIRRPNAAKISEKKNWGAASKGLASTGFRVSDITPDGPIAPLRLACFLRREDETFAYGVDSAVPTYTLFGRPLLAWLVDRLRHQRGAPDTPLEDVGELLSASTGGQPNSRCSHIIVGVGATRYEPYGETTFVEPDDEAIVVLYDSSVHSGSEVTDKIARCQDNGLGSASVLRRRAAVVD